MKENFQNFISSADPDLEERDRLLRENARLRRTINTIKNLFPAEIFRPKNEHLHTATLQRIWNELQRLNQAKH